jgi:glutaredoxin
VTRQTRRWAILLAVVLVVSGEGACNGKRAPVATDIQKAPTVKDDSEGLLLTWIDDKGDFHVETRVTDVPMMGRDAVRVVDPGIDDVSHGDRVFAADLRQTRADGTYLVRTMARTEFEAIAVARREKGGPTLASGASPSGTAALDPTPGGAVDAVRRGPVIIYGAEWCGACHDAARYLRRKGVAYVEKDIEKDAAAAREMQQKLAKRGLNAGSIPVLDVRGKVMVGFNPAEVDAALGAAL